MPKKLKKNVFRQVVVTETGVAFGIIDGGSGNAHTYKLDWDELEKFVREYGQEIPANQLPTKLSGHVRDLMESDG